MILRAPSLLLAIDDLSLPLRENVCLYFSKPKVHAEPIVVPSPLASNAPDNLAVMLYGTVLHEPDRPMPFRMWYHACHWGMSPDWPADIARQYVKYKSPVLMGPVCYAESHDGIEWTKRAMGKVLFKGSRANNAIDLPHALTAAPSVIRDDDDPDPSRRYKMVYEFFPRYSDPPLEGQGRITTVATAVSPDGIDWRFTGVPYVDHFIEQSAFYKHNGRYIISYQAGDAWGSHFSEGGNPAGRIGLARYSYDFEHWMEGCVESLALPEPADPRLRGSKGTYDQNHIGVAPANFGNVCVGMYGLWRNRPEFGEISCDLGLAVSNDGLSFREPFKGLSFIRAADSPATPHPQRAYRTNLCQANGILNVGDETRIYHSRWRNTGVDNEDYYGEISLATLPRDRWAGLGLFPNRETGAVWSCAVELSDPSKQITLNADDADLLRVEVGDERGSLIEGFSGDHAGTCAERSGLDIAVRWPAANISRLAGRLLRVRVILRRAPDRSPKLYAVNLKPAS